MPSREPLCWNGRLQELSNPNCLDLPVIASLPSLNSSDRSLAWPSGGTVPWIWNGSLWVPVAVIPPVRSGIDVTIAVGQVVFGNQGLAANTLRAFPWLVTNQLTLGSVRLEIGTLAASSSVRLALYTDTGQAFPNTLIAASDPAAMDSSTASVKTNTFASNITLVPGLYWLAANSNATPIPRAIPVSAIANVLGTNPAGGTANYTGWSTAFTFAAMPSTFPAAGATLLSGAAPAAMFRTA